MLIYYITSSECDPDYPTNPNTTAASVSLWRRTNGEALDWTYLSFDAKPSVLYDQGVLGELVEQVLPLAGQLTKRTLGYKENTPEKESRIGYIKQGVYTN